MKFLVAVEAGTEPFAAICRQFGISRQAGYELLKRVERDGVQAVHRRRPLAHSFPHATPDHVADLVVQLRKERPTWGPKKLRVVFAQRHPDEKVPAASTIGEILERRGMITPRKRRLRVPPVGTPLSEYTGPNAVWCIDHKGDFPLADRSRCYPLTLLDGASRYLLKCEALRSTSEREAWPHVESAFREHGLPVCIRSDNGIPFACASSPGRLTRMAVWWLKLGIRLERIEPGCPQQNGRLERFHKTLEEAIVGGPYTGDVQQRKFDVLRGEYNHERPHESLGQKPPASAYQTSWRVYPETLPSPQYEHDANVRRVSDKGAVKWQSHILQLTKLLANEPVYFAEIGEEQWEIRFVDHVLGTVDLRTGEPKLRLSSRT